MGCDLEYLFIQYVHLIFLSIQYPKLKLFEILINLFTILE